MLGSIIGDIVGRIYEFNNIKTKDFPLFTEEMEATDDSVLTFATADWLLHGGNVGKYYAKYASKFPYVMGGYGNNFHVWAVSAMRTGIMRPYNSCGNGSAMRVGPVGWVFDDEDEILEHARISADCTHNHPEGIKGAQATALCIYMARQGKSKEEIRKTITERFGYDLSFTIEEIREDYGWFSDRFGNGGLCQASVPQAIVAFLDSTDFEDAIRNAICIGGDSDTIGCITGCIAEAFYGIPENIRERALTYLSFDLSQLLEEFEDKYGKK